MALPEEEMPGTRPSESGPILGLGDLQPDMTGYLFDGSLGSGAMGSVYAATDPAGRSVAVKVLHDPQPDEMTRRRFEREVAALQKLDHPGVPEVYDAGQLPDGRLFLVMERLHGTTLEDWYDEPGHTRLEALELILEALDALAVAHVRGVVHRDIKPENLFVLATPEQGRRVKILDFGIALHHSEGEAKRTATGISVGTPCYMSPEQAARPKLVGAHSDVWSIGVVLYEALCGELPFDGETAHGVVVAICAAQHPPLADRSPQTHPDLLSLVESCLVKARDDRPIDAAELKDAVAALLARDEVRATLGGPAATPDLHVTERPSEPFGASESARFSEPFAATEEVTDPEAEHDPIAVAATISAQLITPQVAQPTKSRLPAALAIVGVLFGVGAAALYLRPSAPDPVSNEAPTRIEAAETDETPLVIEQVAEVNTEPEVVAETETGELDPPEPDLVVRPRMRAQPRVSMRVDETEDEEDVVVETTETTEMETTETMEPLVAAMDPVVATVMQPVMQPVMAAPPTMQPVAVRPTTMTTMRTRPRMRPSMMREPGDRPGFVTF